MGELEVLVQAVVELAVEVLETETLADVGQSKAIYTVPKFVLEISSLMSLA